jgi:hypothetical protein
MIKEGVLARQSGELVLVNRLLSDAVVVDALGDVSNCPTSDAEPTMSRRCSIRPVAGGCGR